MTDKPDMCAALRKIDTRFQHHNQGAWVPQQMWDELKAAVAANAARIAEQDEEIARLRVDVVARSWCARCGCGNDAAGYAHLENCGALPLGKEKTQ